MTEELMFHPERVVAPTRADQHDSPAVNTAAVLNFAAAAGARHAIYKPVWSYSNTPTSGQLTVSTGGEVLFQVDITAGGPGFFPIMIIGKLGQNLVVTLAAAGAAISGKINVEKHWVKRR